MSDFDTGAAPAASDSAPTSAVIDNVADQGVQTPNPVKTEPNPGSNPEPKEEAKKPLSTREALEKAAAKVKADSDEAKNAPVEKKGDDKAPKADTQADLKPKPAADQKADTAPKVETPSPSKHAAPERFSPDAKTAWEAAPEPIKAEVHRAIRELEQGHQKYKADAEAYHQIREYDDLAKQHGTSVKDALDRYTGLEKRLASADPNIKTQAVAEVLQYAGINPREYAAYISGQRPDQVQSQNDQTIAALQREIAGLKQQVGGVTSTIQEQRNTALMDNVSKFAEMHPRFDELGESIAKLIQTGMASELEEAYAMAERLNPASTAQTAPAAPANTPDLQAQTLRGSKSVSGAPTAGSNPASKGKPSSSVRESLKRAAAQVG